MKKKWLILPLFILILVFTLLPISTVAANPGNLVENGDFSDNLNNWQVLGNVNIISGEAILDSTVSPNISNVKQNINTCDKDSILSFDIKPTTYGSGPTSVGINIFKNDTFIDSAWYFYNSLPLDTWASYSFKLSDLWNDYHGVSMPDFDEVLIFAEAAYGDIIVFDNFSLEGLPCPGKETAWVRTMPMTCWQVWINEDNMFEFIFWYPYKSNNWVRIYDMEGVMVYEVEVLVDEPRIVVDLPDGMYTVKTFWIDSVNPIQEFIIGKPGPEM